MIKWFSDEGLIDIRKKDPTSIQKSGKALFCKSKNKMSDGNNFYISGPCRSFYDYDYDKNGNKIFNFKIVYLQTINENEKIGMFEEIDQYDIMTRYTIFIDNDAIVSNASKNTNLPVCIVTNENKKVIASCNSFKILGPSRAIYDRDKIGMRKTWIETNSEIEIMDLSN